VPSQASSDWANFASLEQVDTSYDSYFRPVAQALNAGGTTYALSQSHYDAVGRADCVAQRMNPADFATVASSFDACHLDTNTGSFGPDRIVKTDYAPDGAVSAVTSAYLTSDAATVASTYTANGRLQTLTDGESHRTTYVYDAHDRLSQTLYPSPTQLNTSNSSDYEQLGYDANGNVTSRRLRDGTTIGYGFDNLNRRISKDLPTGETDASYAYDNLGRLTGITQGSASLGFAYDALGRNTGQTDAHGQPISPFSGRTLSTPSHHYPLTGVFLEKHEDDD
jgi:YD repeat-containing protein